MKKDEWLRYATRMKWFGISGFFVLFLGIISIEYSPVISFILGMLGGLLIGGGSMSEELIRDYEKETGKKW